MNRPIECADMARGRDRIIRESLERHVLGLRGERINERTAKTDRERRAAFLAVDELQASLRVLASMARRFGLDAEVDRAERRIALDEIEVRAMVAR